MIDLADDGPIFQPILQKLKEAEQEHGDAIPALRGLSAALMAKLAQAKSWSDVTVCFRDALGTATTAIEQSLSGHRCDSHPSDGDPVSN